VGKSTLFNAMTRAGAEAANYPFCTIDPNVGMVPVPDERLDHLSEKYNPKKITPTVVEVVDIAGLVKGAAEGAGLGNQFLGNIRDVDAIFHVVRCFEDADIVHSSGKVDPLSDIQVIDTELCIKDMETLTKRTEKTEKLAKSGDKESLALMPTYKKVKKALEDGTPVRNSGLTSDELDHIKELQLLTAKPVLYCCNVIDTDLPEGGSMVQAVKDYAAKEGSLAIVISAKVESEIVEMEEDEKKEFLASYNLTESGLDRLAKEGYNLLGLITFLTAGPEEVRAWTVTKGSFAPQAAGVIHTDFEKGFIRAEVMKYDDWSKLGSEQAVKDGGKYRVEGKEYVMQDGDIVYFRFST